MDNLGDNITPLLLHNSMDGLFTLAQLSAVQCSAVQFSAVQCSAVQCSAVQCSSVQCRALHCGVVQCHDRHWGSQILDSLTQRGGGNSIVVLFCTLLYCTVLHCTVLYGTVLYSDSKGQRGGEQDNFSSSYPWKTLSVLSFLCNGI